MSLKSGGLIDEQFEMPHDFEIDLNYLVIANYKLTLDAINRDEQDELCKFEDDNPDVVLAIQDQVHRFYDDLRRAANNLSAVALVTRIQHWVSKLAKAIPGQTKLTKTKKGESKLVSELHLLNSKLKIGPVPISFFESLVTVRDSVIHGDSKAEWKFNGSLRRVPDCYVNSFEDTQISDSQLHLAIENAVLQVTWYDEQLQSKLKG